MKIERKRPVNKYKITCVSVYEYIYRTSIVSMFRNPKLTEQLQQICGFSSVTAQPDGPTTLSAWVPAG